jgi:uncharacterized membrane protein SpoIIM required for sporulation
MSTNRPAQWQKLAEILHQIDRRGLRALSTQELLDFGRLYRRAASDLSFARTHGLEPNITDYLNQLVGRAYGHVYMAETKGFSAIPSFFLHDFPAAVRTLWPFIAGATAICLVTMLLVFVIVWFDPGVANLILPPEIQGAINGVVERHRTPQDWMPFSMRPTASAGIMTNNVGVAFFAFAGGILLGLGTIYVLIANGLMLGAVAAAVAQAGVGTNFWAFVAPHGVLELPAIFIAAGAGLLLGYTLINPGDYDRKTALKLAARQAGTLVLGVVAMLSVAGTIEGFFSPTLTPEPIKYLFALAAAILLWSYLFVMPLRGEASPK